MWIPESWKSSSFLLLQTLTFTHGIASRDYDSFALCSKQIFAGGALKKKSKKLSRSFDLVVVLDKPVNSQ